MATTTTNYGFDIPQSTDLVKDGATAIATLGQDIDTAMNTALGTKKAGMVLLNTTSFSAVASQSFNNVFSADYLNYRIVCNGTVASAVGSLQFRLRVAGVDSSVNYNKQRFNVSNATFTGARATSQSAGEAGGFASTYNNGLAIDIFSPFEAKATTFSSWGTDSRDNVQIEISQNIHTSATSYDGITFIGNGGNLTNCVFSVYGYNK
jgi:hypothetical protein